MANDSVAEVSTPLLSKKPEAEEKPRSKTEDVNPSKTVLKFEDIGVWTIMTEVNLMTSWRIPGRELIAQGREMLAVFPIVYLFLQDCFSVSPWLMVIYLLSSLWASTEVRAIITHSALLLTT